MIRQVMSGAVMLAFGRRDGILKFGDTTAAFLASLAPVVAFQLVGAFLLLLSGDVREAASTVLLTVVLLAAPAVVSHALAVRWGREAEWLRYATAFNWCQCTIPFVAPLAVAVLTLVTAGRLSGAALEQGAILALGAFALWLHYVLARAGLELGRGRSVLLVLGVNVAVALMVLGPLWVAMGLGA